MIKTSKKQLKEIAKSLGAYYCGGNVYNHENISEYLRQGNWMEISKYVNTKYNKIGDLLEDLHNSYNLDNFKTYDNSKGLYRIDYKEQLCYSAGTYGNSGQLRKFDIVNNDDETIYSFYTYYC